MEAEPVPQHFYKALADCVQKNFALDKEVVLMKDELKKMTLEEQKFNRLCKEKAQNLEKLNDLQQKHFYLECQYEKYNKLKEELELETMFLQAQNDEAPEICEKYESMLKKCDETNACLKRDTNYWRRFALRSKSCRDEVEAELKFWKEEYEKRVKMVSDLVCQFQETKPLKIYSEFNVNEKNNFSADTAQLNKPKDCCCDTSGLNIYLWLKEFMETIKHSSVVKTSEPDCDYVPKKRAKYCLHITQLKKRKVKRSSRKTFRALKQTSTNVYPQVSQSLIHNFASMAKGNEISNEQQNSEMTALMESILSFV